MKDRIRLTETGRQLLERVREGTPRSWEETIWSEMLWQLERSPDLFLARVGIGNPRVEGLLLQFLRDGLIEKYQDSEIDKLEGLWGTPRDEEEYYPEITEKGRSLMALMTHPIVLTWNLGGLGEWLYRYEDDEESVPPWIIKGLQREGYLEGDK